MKEIPSLRGGFSLVEVMMAVLILSVLAVAGASSLHHARSSATVQKQRRMALEIASSRLEDLRAAAYSSISPASYNYGLRYITRTGTVWSVQNGYVSQNVRVGERMRPMVTTVRYVDTDGVGNPSYDALRLAVTVQYHTNVNSWVSLETLRAP